MDRETKHLVKFRKWFDKYVVRGFDKKCPDFTWDCFTCRAHFVKMIFDDFVEEMVSLEKDSRSRK